MAAFVFGYRCPDCGGKFRWPREAPPPERCPHCNAWVSEDEPAEFVPAAPAIKKNVYAKAVDQTYREMERQSIERADEAAGMLEDQYAAQPSDEHDGLVKVTQREQVAKLRSDLKITNMKDPSEMRAGDTAHIGPGGGQSPVARAAAYQPYSGGVSGAAVSPMVGTIQAITTDHTPRAIGMIRAGNMGRHG